MANLLALNPSVDAHKRTCRAIVETPRGCLSKYDYDAETGLFALAGVLPAGMAFPLAFGFVPGTLGGDGDPLDILILADEDLPTGCLVQAQLLGVIEATQKEKGKKERNDRLLAKVEQSRSYADLTEIDQLGEGFCDELQTFFATYNALKGKKFKIKKTGNAKRAFKILLEGIRTAAQREAGAT